MGTSQMLLTQDSPRQITKTSPLSLSQILSSDNCDMVVKHLDDDDVLYAERNPPKVLHGRYLKGPCVARGSVAVVKEAYDLWNDCVVALKVFKWGKKQRNEERVQAKRAYSRETTTMKMLPVHRNLVHLVDAWSSSKKGFVSSLPHPVVFFVCDTLLTYTHCHLVVTDSL